LIAIFHFGIIFHFFFKFTGILINLCVAELSVKKPVTVPPIFVSSQ